MNKPLNAKQFDALFYALQDRGGRVNVYGDKRTNNALQAAGYIAVADPDDTHGFIFRITREGHRAMLRWAVNMESFDSIIAKITANAANATFA